VFYQHSGKPSAPSSKSSLTTATPPECTSSATDLSMLALTAVCYQSIGEYRTAVNYFSKALALDQTSCCWYQREVALALWSKLNKSLKTFNIENEIDPRVKDGWCKRATWRYILPSSSGSTTNTVKYIPMVQPKDVPSEEDAPLHTDSSVNATSTAEHSDSGHTHTHTHTCPPRISDSMVLALRNITIATGRWMQLSCVGFLPNERQVHLLPSSATSPSSSLLPSLLQHRTYFYFDLCRIVGFNNKRLAIHLLNAFFSPLLFSFLCSSLLYSILFF
jgi:tetratricopeptide (TPR) repeat protein